MIINKEQNHKNRLHDFFIRHRYAFSCVMLSTASLMGFINPFLSSFIALNLVSHFNIHAVVAAVIGIFAVKGTRFYLRSNVTKYVGENPRAPMVWLSRRISKKLWWMEPMISNWGWAGMVINRIMGGKASSQLAMAITSALSDTLNTLVSGIIYYFTQNYALSLLSALIFPSLTILPWFARKSIRINKMKHKG